MTRPLLILMVLLALVPRANAATSLSDVIFKNLSTNFFDVNFSRTNDQIVKLKLDASQFDTSGDTITIINVPVGSNPTIPRIPYKNGPNSYGDSALSFIDTNTVGAVELDVEDIGVTNLVSGGVVLSVPGGDGMGHLTNLANGAGFLQNDGSGVFSWGSGGGSFWSNITHNLYPAQQEDNLFATNIHGVGTLYAVGNLNFTPDDSDTLVNGENDISTYRRGYILLDGDGTTNVWLRLSDGNGAGTALLLTQISTNTMTLFNGDALYDNPSEHIFLPWGDWTPTHQGESILLVHTFRGWSGVQKFGSPTNLLTQDLWVFTNNVLTTSPSVFGGTNLYKFSGVPTLPTMTITAADGTRAVVGVANGQPFIDGSSSGTAFNLTGPSSGLSMTPGAIRPTQSGINLSGPQVSNGFWFKDIGLDGTTYIRGFGDVTGTNYARLAISYPSTNSGPTFDLQTSGSAGPPRGFFWGSNETIIASMDAVGGGIFIGQNSRSIWGSRLTNGESLIAYRNPIGGEQDYNEFAVGVADGMSHFSHFDTFGSSTNFNINVGTSFGNGRSLNVRVAEGDTFLQLNGSIGAYVYFTPEAVNGAIPFYLRSETNHTSGDFFALLNGPTTNFLVSAVSGYDGSGTHVFTDDGTFKTLGGGGGSGSTNWVDSAGTNSTLAGVSSAFGFELGSNILTNWPWITTSNNTAIVTVSTSPFAGLFTSANGYSQMLVGKQSVAIQTVPGNPGIAVGEQVTSGSETFLCGLNIVENTDYSGRFADAYWLSTVDKGSTNEDSASAGFYLDCADELGNYFRQAGYIKPGNLGQFSWNLGGDGGSFLGSFAWTINADYDHPVASVGSSGNINSIGSYTSGAPSGGSAAPWKFGSYRTNYVQADVSGNAVNLQTGIGVTDASSTSSGNVGEFVSSLVASGSAVTLTNASAWNITSISLTAGDWDVEGNINFSATTATVTGTQGGISTTSATLPTDGSEVYSGVQVTLLSEKDSVTLPRKRVNVSTTTVVYLVAKSTFSAGSVVGFGSISARRVR